MRTTRVSALPYWFAPSEIAIRPPVPCSRSTSRWSSTPRAGQLAHLLRAQPGRVPHLVGGERAAVPGAQDVVGQRTRGRRLVEDGRAGLLDVAPQPVRGPPEPVSVEAHDRGVAGRQLCRVQVPALVVATL